MPRNLRREPATSNRHRRPVACADRAETVSAFSSLYSWSWTQNDAVGYHSLPHQAPQRDQQLASQCHDHGLARAGRSLRAGSIPPRQSAVLLEHEKSPRQLDHAGPHANVARSGQPLFQAPASALVRRTRQARITPHSSSVAQVARQYLLHQHVGRLDADTNDPRQKAHHRMRSIAGRTLELFQPGAFNLLDLISNKPPPLHVPTQLCQRVRRYGLALGRAQAVNTIGRLLQLGVEAADTKAGQRRLHAVDDPAFLSNQALALAARSLGVFVGDGRDGDHLAVIALST